MPDTTDPSRALVHAISVFDVTADQLTVKQGANHVGMHFTPLNVWFKSAAGAVEFFAHGLNQAAAVLAEAEGLTDDAAAERVIEIINGITSPVRCVHCGEPIAQHTDQEWWHVVDGRVLGYQYCGTHIDDDGNEVGGNPAEPPRAAE